MSDRIEPALTPKQWAEFQRSVGHGFLYDDVIGAFASQWIENGRGYVYTYLREVSRLFVVACAQPR